jgi:tetratricopeptide (TPR) repeat protein
VRIEFEPALEYAHRVLAIDPDNATAHANLGALYMDMGDYPAARRALEKSLELEPANLPAAEMLSAVLRYLGEEGASLQVLDDLCARDPARPDCRFWRGQTLLQMGRYDEGWRDLESRWQDELKHDWRVCPQPVWTGDALGSKTLLIWAEQGLGDTLQFIRYADTVREGNAAVRASSRRCSPKSCAWSRPWHRSTR